jgi:hypothetical protein
MKAEVSNGFEPKKFALLKGDSKRLASLALSTAAGLVQNAKKRDTANAVSPS